MSRQELDKTEGRPPARGQQLWLLIAEWVAVGSGAAVGLTLLLSWLLLGVAPRNIGAVPHEGVSELDMIKIALSVVAGIGGTVALVVAYRRQHQLERDEIGFRERDKAYRDRYASAAQQLGDPQPAVRLAGVYAMANLADDWPDQRQQCVDVLCAYVRLPWADTLGEPEPGSTTTQHSWPAGDNQHSVSRTYPGRAGEREVRRTLIRVLADHLQAGAALGWSDLNFDLRQAHLPDARLAGARFSKPVNLSGAHFSGTADFAGAHFSGAADFAGASFSADASFAGAMFFAGTVDFARASFSADVSFARASFSFTTAEFAGASFSADSSFFEARFSTANFTGARFSAGAAYFSRARFSTANFTGACFSAAYFTGASFSAADFSGATFSAIADFRETFFQVAPSFRRVTYSVPPVLTGVKLTPGIGLKVFEGDAP